MAKTLAAVSAALALAGCAHAFSAKPPAPDFTLTSDRGAPWTLSAQHGSAVALFFGYTHCADTCPDTLAKLAASIHAARAGRHAEIAFVTIDPKRDTPAILRAYVRRFSGATIVGLTGTAAQISAVEREYHVYADTEDDHSAYTFLIDPQGDEAAVLDDDDRQAHIAAVIRSNIE